MENSEALVLFSELSRATVESRLKVLVQLLLTKYGPTHGLWKWGRDRRASDRHIVSFFVPQFFEFCRPECVITGSTHTNFNPLHFIHRDTVNSVSSRQLHGARVDRSFSTVGRV